MPVAKHQKKPLTLVSVNNGLHIHGLLLMPPTSRLKQDVVGHFRQYDSLYVRNGLLMVHLQQSTLMFPQSSITSSNQSNGILSASTILSYFPSQPPNNTATLPRPLSLSIMPSSTVNQAVRSTTKLVKHIQVQIS